MKTAIKSISERFRRRRTTVSLDGCFPSEGVFREAEIEELLDLNSMTSIREGNIRGPVDKWTVVGDIRCGKHTGINAFFNARGKVRIGKYCAIGQYVGLISGNHRIDMPNQQIWLSKRLGFAIPAESKGPVEIGHNVWIGDKATVLSGVQVGHGCVVAAGSVVTKSVRPFEVVAGAPARVIKKRFSDKIIDQLLGIQWWHWSDEKIEKNRIFFESNLSESPHLDLRSLIVE